MFGYLILQVDFDESRIQQRFVVRPNINPELDESKPHTT